MKWDELDALVRKHLYINGISDHEIAWIRIEPDNINIEIIMVGFDKKYGIRTKQLERDDQVKRGEIKI